MKKDIKVYEHDVNIKDIKINKANLTDNGNRKTSAFDTFNRADCKVEVSEDGQNYLVAGDNDNCLFYVKNKIAKLNNLGNAYMSLTTTNKIETLGAEWHWNSGTTQATVAMVITNDEDLGLKNLLHFITNSKNWALQIRKEATGSYLPTLLSGNYDSQLKCDGTIYRFEMTVDRDKNIVYLRLPDGNIKSYTNSDISLVSGHRGFWQVIRRNSTDEEPCFNSIWLTEKQNRTLGSTKENLNIFPAIIKTKQYSDDTSVSKKVYSFRPTQSGWYRVLNGVLDTLIGKAKFYTTVRYDSTITDEEIYFHSSAFNNASPVINQIKHSSFNDGIINAFRVGNNGSNNHYLDVYIKSATSPVDIFCEFEGANLLNALSDSAQTVFNPTSNPSIPTNYVVLNSGKGIRTTAGIHSIVTEQEFETITTTGSVNMNYSISAIDASVTSITLTLPNSTQNSYHVHTFSRTDGSGNSANVIGFFSDGTTTKSLTRGVPLKVIANPQNNQWIII